METFVPFEKLSKKKKKELNRARRGVWTCSPVTRRPANPKAYNRKKARREHEDAFDPCFLFHRGYFFRSAGRMPKQARKARLKTE